MLISEKNSETTVWQELNPLLPEEQMAQYLLSQSSHHINVQNITTNDEN